MGMRAEKIARSRIEEMNADLCGNIIALYIHCGFKSNSMVISHLGESGCFDIVENPNFV